MEGGCRGAGGDLGLMLGCGGNRGWMGEDATRRGKGGMEDVVDGGWETEPMHTCTLGWRGIGLCPERSKSWNEL